MPEELGCIVDNLQSLKTIDYGDLKVFTGEWSNKLNTKILISVAWSGWGKVSCARATTRLLSSLSKEEKIDLLIFTGVAGAVDINLKQWDIVISEAVLQHDMDARPLFKKFVIPAINQSKIYADKEVIDRLYNCLIINIKNQINPIFGSINKGLIATGDKFISDKETLQNLSEEIPHLLAVEMEGAAFAQVATQEKVKWVITI